MGRVINAINGVWGVCISLSPHSLLPLTRPPHDPNHLNSKISLHWVLKINITYSYVSRAGKEYFLIGFSPYLRFVTDSKTYLHALRILGLALRGCIVAFVHDYCCGYLYYCTDSFRKKRNPPFSDNRMKSGAVIMINIGAVHGPVTKSYYPRPLSSVLWFVCLLEIVC